MIIVTGPGGVAVANTMNFNVGGGSSNLVTVNDLVGGGLVLGGQELWDRIAGMISGKRGSEEIHWTRREGQNTTVAERVRRLVDQEQEDRLKIWV